MNKKDQTSHSELLHPYMCVGSRLNKLSRVFNKLYTGYLKDAGVTLTQTSILFYISGMQPVEQREVGKFLQLERSTVTRDLKRLITRNYIRKTDQGVSPILELTDEGQAFVKVFKPLWEKAQQDALNQLGPDGQQALNTLIQLLEE